MGHQVVLSWSAPSDATGAATYNVYRSAAACPGGTFTKINVSPITVLSYTDTTVVVGSTYCYYATHVEGTVESAPSNKAGGTVTPGVVTISIVVN